MCVPSVRLRKPGCAGLSTIRTPKIFTPMVEDDHPPNMRCGSSVFQWTILPQSNLLVNDFARSDVSTDKCQGSARSLDPASSNPRHPPSQDRDRPQPQLSLASIDQSFGMKTRILRVSPPHHWPSSVTESVVLPPLRGKHHAKTSTDTFAQQE
jgi:hypothetical protein